MKRQVWAHVALALVGLAAVVWSLTWGANPTIVCRDVVMTPGDVCVNAQGTRQQTYTERFDAAQHARPVIGGVGALVAGFGVVLAANQVKREGSSGRTPRPHPATD